MIGQRLARRLLALRSFGTVPLETAATDVPSTSTVRDGREKGDGKKKGHPPPIIFVDHVLKHFPQQLATLETAVKDAEASRKARLNSEKSDKLMEILTTAVVSPNCRLVPVGSSVSGLGGESSDLDLVLLPNDEYEKSFAREFLQNENFKLFFMNTMASLITRSMQSNGIELLHKDVFDNTRVDPVHFSLKNIQIPLIRMKFTQDTNIDVQFPFDPHFNYQAFRNTNLVKTYVQADERFPQLFLWLKTIFNALEVRDSSYSLLSSYHCLLLCIHFLQSEQSLSPWPVLPVLCETHPELVGRALPITDVIKRMESPTITLEWQSKNKMPISELIVRFVDYYSGFKPAHEAIFIDRGMVQKRRQRSHEAARLLLFDPYGSTTVCLSQYALKAFSQAIAFLKRKFRNGQMIDSFPSFPEYILFREETKWASWRTQREAAIESRKRAEAAQSSNG